MFDRKGGVIAGTDINKSAIVKNNKVQFVCKNKKREVKIKQPVALSWLLFDAVQRLPRKKFTPVNFTLIDHFDQVKRNNIISFYNTIEVDLPVGESIKLHSYKQFGKGILPVVYYVDDAGRLLFVISGIETYIINS